MKLIICSLSIVLLVLGINFANSQMANETNSSLPLHGNQNISTSLNVSDSESSEKNAAFVNSTDLQFKFKVKWGSKGTGNDQFQRPHDVAFDSKGFVYVTDRENNNVQKFTHNGTFVKAWGSRGSDNGQFIVPYSIDIDSKDHVYVVDRENHRIQEFDGNGTFLAKWGNGRGNSDKQFNRPEDIALSPNGIYVTDTGNDRVMKFDNNFSLITKWGNK